MDKQRNYHRIDFHTGARIRLADGDYCCTLINLALQGAQVATEQPLPLNRGEEARLDIDLQETLTLSFTVRLVHGQDNRYGFLFLEADADSLAHLRRLLELNFGDAEQAATEFCYWLKHHAETLC